ncbi:MAG: hypothetical protein ABWY57_02480 [Mycetocola sp.]
MFDVLGTVSVIGGVIAVMASLVVVARRIRLRGAAGPAIGAAMAAYDEAMHSSAYTQFIELQAQIDRKQPAPAASGTDRDLRGHAPLTDRHSAT